MRAAADLARYEATAYALRSLEPLPTGRLSVSHYRAVHKHLFGDVYVWAGRYRTIRTGKGGNWFCYPENIEREMKRAFLTLQTRQQSSRKSPGAFAMNAAAFLAELNAIHPFHEGNGRTQLSFLALMAASAGYALDLERLEPAAFLAAMIASFHGDERELARQILALTEP